MIKQCRHGLLAAATGAAFLLVGGCAANNTAMIDEVRGTADEALRTANTADYNAQTAKQMADQALTDIRRVMKKLNMKSMMK